MYLVSDALNFLARLEVFDVKDGEILDHQHIMPKSFVDWREKAMAAQAERVRAEEERKAQYEAAIEDNRVRLEEMIRTDNQLMDRYETLERLVPKGGTLARIHRDYGSYRSIWDYVMREDGSLARTRDQDGATVEFETFEQLLDDYQGYRHYGFQIS